MKLNKLMQLIKDNSGSEVRKIRSEMTDNEAHIYIYDIIDSDWGASASGLVAALDAAGEKPVCLHINSPGGDAFEGKAMASVISGHKAKVTCCIDGIAASAATTVALAADEVCITENGLFMIHNAWMMAIGDCRDLRQTADLLEKVDGTINADYARKTGATPEQVSAWMDAETWFNAQEALDAGFVDSIDPSSKCKPSSKWNLSAYANAPTIEPEEPDLSQQAELQTLRNRNRLKLFQI